MSNNKEENPSKPLCFVLMPITDPEGYEPGHFKRVYESIFKPACSMAGYQAIRADEVAQANLIHLDILRKLLECPMAICDLSNRNPNAMFELGIRQAFDKPVVLVQEEGTKAIFDIGPLRYCEYRNRMRYDEVIEDQMKIAAAITATATPEKGDVNSIVRLLSLTPASIPTFSSESEKDTALLQLIMSEISGMKSQLNNITKSAEKLNVQGQIDNPLDPTLHKLIDIENQLNEGKLTFDEYSDLIHVLSQTLSSLNIHNSKTTSLSRALEINRLIRKARDLRYHINELRDQSKASDNTISGDEVSA